MSETRKWVADDVTDEPILTEDMVFTWLRQRYVQRADDRQKAMGLQYMEAETRGLAKDILRYFEQVCPPVRPDHTALPSWHQVELFLKHWAHNFRHSREIGYAEAVEGAHEAFSACFGGDVPEPQPDTPGLRDAVRALIERYVKNPGSEHEQIACITPRSAQEMSPEERRDDATWRLWDALRAAVDGMAPPPAYGDTEGLTELALLSALATPGTLRECGHDSADGPCSCGMIWATEVDAPLATVVTGDWGDEHASLRFVKGTGGEGSINPKVEAYIEKIVYGHVPPDRAKANARFIRALWNTYRTGQLPAPAVAPAVPELKADMTKALPDGSMDDSTYSAVEEALDRADAPCTDNGRWLSLPERIAALSAELRRG